MEVEIVPSYYSNPVNLTFWWNVTSYDGRVMIIKLYFDNAIYVSSESEPEKVNITFYDISLFFDTEG